MTLLAKKDSELTAGERASLLKAIGTSALPYPASHFVTGADGKLQMEIGVIADDAGPLAVYADQPHDHVVGLLYREMAIPSLLHVQKDAILRRAPESKGRLMAVLGDPGSGKSHLAKLMARVRDGRPAEVIDCGGRYMGDLLWEQVIDYGEDFKTALTSRLRAGGLSTRSVEILEKNFAEALVKDSSGKIIDIDWDKTAQPRQKSGSKDKPVFESTEEAVERSLKLIKMVAEYEGIPTQAVNNVGVKKVPGIIKRLHDEGREGILDEYTKSIEGSDDSLQTVLQYINGEIDEVTVTNSMKVNGREETYAYTLRREDMKPGFFVTMTGNKKSDGFSTHALSRSAYSRIPVYTIENPLPVDWKHRISQILTGLPLSTLYSVFSDMAQDDPQEFGDMLVEMRLMGLSDAEKARVPAHQITMLRNWQMTNAAVEKLANFYMYWSKIIDPQSDLYDPEKSQNSGNIENILPEISAAYRDECAIDFRKVIQDIGESLKVKPKVKAIDSGSNLRLNFSAVGRQKTDLPALRPEVMASEFGTRLEDVLLERIGTMTAGRPHLQEALMKEARERGVVTLPGQAAQQNDTLRKLLNQDIFASVGGIKSVVAIREILADHKKREKPELQGKADDEIVPTDQAAAACEELARLAKGDLNVNPRMGRVVLMGEGQAGSELTGVFNQAAAVDSIGQPERPEPEQLIRSTDFVESLKIPALANVNMRSIWRKTLSAENLVPETEESTPVVEIAEGIHASKIGITTLMTRSANGKAIPVHIMLDGERKKSLIVTDEIDDKTKAALGSDYVVVTYDDPNAENQVAGFIRDTLRHPSRKDQTSALEKQVTCAFALRAGNQNDLKPLAQMMVRKDLPTDAAVYMVNKPV